MKKFLTVLMAVLMIATFVLFAVASGEDETADQGNAPAEGNVEKAEDDNTTQATEAADTTAADNTSIGEYSVVIDSCRLAKDMMGEPIVIVKYLYTNVSNDTPTSFMVAFNEGVYQNGVGLNESYLVEESANYDSDSQMKEIKAGATLEVEVAYELDDTTTPIDVEVKEFISFNDKTLTKTFTIT